MAVPKTPNPLMYWVVWGKSMGCKVTGILKLTSHKSFKIHIYHGVFEVHSTNSLIPTHASIDKDGTIWMWDRPPDKIIEKWLGNTNGKIVAQVEFDGDWEQSVIELRLDHTKTGTYIYEK